MKNKKLQFENESESVFISDMRPGFTEDGVRCTLTSGTYDVLLDEPIDVGGRGFQLVLSGAVPDRRQEVGFVSVDMARVGIFNRRAFLDHFAGEFEDLFEWSDSAVEPSTDGAVEITPDGNANLRALVVTVGSDGHYCVEYLYSGAEKVGLSVTPVVRESSDGRARKWIRVDVKFTGIGEPWSYFDDRDFELTREDVLEELVVDLIGTAVHLTNNDIDVDNVDPNTELRQYLTRFHGISKICAFLDVGGERAKRVVLPESFDATKLSEDATLREIGDFVFSVAQYARRNEEYVGY